MFCFNFHLLNLTRQKSHDDKLPFPTIADTIRAGEFYAVDLNLSTTDKNIFLSQKRDEKVVCFYASRILESVFVVPAEKSQTCKKFHSWSSSPSSTDFEMECLSLNCRD